MIVLFLLNGLLAFILGWVMHKPELYLIKDGEYEKHDYLLLDLDGEEYEVIAR